MIALGTLHFVPCMRLISFMLITFIAMCYFHSYFTLLLMILLILMPLCSFFLTFLALKNLNINTHTTTWKTTRNSQFSFPLSLHHALPIPLLCVTITYFFENTFSGTKTPTDNVTAFFLPKEKKTLPFFPDCSNCGIVNMTVTRICMTDFFGLIDFKKEINATQSLTIFPLPTKFHQPPKISEEENASKKTSSQEFSHVREYIPGDRLNRIHWKLTARQNNLMVKEYLPLADTQPILFIELYNDQDCCVNQTLDLAYSCALSLLKEAQFPILCWFDCRMGRVLSKTLSNTEELEECFLELFCSPVYSSPYFEKDTMMEHEILINKEGIYDTNYNFNQTTEL